MAPQSSQQQQGGDTSLGPFWIMVALFALAWGVWYFAHVYIALVILQVKLAETRLISLFTSHVGSLITLIRHTSPVTVEFGTLTEISTAVGNYLRYPIAMILGILGIVVYFSHANTRYKKNYDMQRLIEEEKTSWPQITPITDLDLVHTDIDKGPWAMAMRPMQFAKKHRLLQEEQVVPAGGSLRQRSKTVALLKKDEAYQVFSLQLGPYWKGIEQLSAPAQALFAVFAARANRDQDGANQLLYQIAASTAGGKLNFAGTDALLAKHKDNKAVIKLLQTHAFELTVMASMLLLARQDGVLASADFLWLKPVDRPLWFMLNSVGRQTPFTEVAGPFAHWLAERQLGRKLSVPMVEEAANALENALKNIIYVPDTEV